MRYLKRFNENDTQKLFTYNDDITFCPTFNNWETRINEYSEGIDFESKMDEELTILFFVNNDSTFTNYFFQFDWYSVYEKYSKTYTIEIGHNPTIDDVKDILGKSLIFRENYDIIMKNKDELDDYPDYDQIGNKKYGESSPGSVSMRTFERFINKLQMFKVKYDYLFTGKDMGLL